MCGWLSKIFKACRPQEPTPFTATQSITHPAISSPLYFLDLDESGKFFANYVHVTSSVNAELISKEGLKPLEATPRLIQFLSKAYPNECPQALLAEIRGTNNPAAQNVLLVTQRLDEEKRGNAVVALLPLGEKRYLASAADNATQDGGEFFKAARTTVNTLRQIVIGPLYPNATSIVFIARHYLKQNGLSLVIEGSPSEIFELDLTAVNGSDISEYWSPFQTTHPLHVTTPYPPEYLLSMDLNRYLEQKFEPISPAARRKIEGMLAGQSKII